MEALEPGAAVERLARWRDAGGAWTLTAQTPTSITVGLLTCDGGEEMERIVSDDPAFVAYVAAASDGS